MAGPGVSTGDAVLQSQGTGAMVGTLYGGIPVRRLKTGRW